VRGYIEAAKIDPLVKTPIFKNPSHWSGRENSGSPS
jgi:hypothetical protein